MKRWIIYQWARSESCTLEGWFWDKMMLLIATFPQGNPILWGIATGLLAASCLFSLYLVLWY